MACPLTAGPTVSAGWSTIRGPSGIPDFASPRPATRMASRSGRQASGRAPAMLCQLDARSSDQTEELVLTPRDLGESSAQLVCGTLSTPVWAVTHPPTRAPLTPSPSPMLLHPTPSSHRGVVGQFISIARALLLDGRSVTTPPSPAHHDWWADCALTELAGPTASALRAAVPRSPPTPPQVASPRPSEWWAEDSQATVDWWATLAQSELQYQNVSTHMASQDAAEVISVLCRSLTRLVSRSRVP